MTVTRVAKNVCIYWETSETNPDLENVGLSGQCSANKYFDVSRIRCYNNGQCDGAGTCRSCTAYDVGGLQISHKDTTQIRTAKSLYVWNSEQSKYIAVQNLDPGEKSNLYSTLIQLTRSQSVGWYNASGLQLPINLAIYNLRAKFKKCCNWDGPPVVFSKDKYGIVKATVFGSGSASSLEYLPEDYSGEDAETVVDASYDLSNSDMISQKCRLGTLTDSWSKPLTSENPTFYGCNGCKPECPYYTGPRWAYCVDDKMDIGDSISAAQIMELRYYSDDWVNMSNAASTWKKRFKDPVIWAWSGDFEFTGQQPGSYFEVSNNNPTAEDNPLIIPVSIEDFTTSEPIIVIGPKTPATQGTNVKEVDGEAKVVDFPTLVGELFDVASNIKVAWPKSTSSSPFTFKTFRIGQNIIRIFVDTPYTSTVYSSNLTKNSQEDKNDSAYILYMQTYHPDDLGSVEASSSTTGLVSFDVVLEYGQTENVIKFFTRDPTSEVGEYLTTKCYINHKMYHGVIAQTKGTDHVGHSSTQTWVDYFEKVSFEAEIHQITGDTHVDEIFWDTHAGSKLTLYPIEEVIEEEMQSDWHALHCNFAAVTFSDTRCNSVMPWKLSGSVRGADLKVYLDRSNNDSATEDGNVDLEVYYKSSNGTYLPGNVIIVGSKSSTSLSSALDPTKDKIYATYAVTEYKQGPVSSEDREKLKYPDMEKYYIDTMPLSIEYSPDTKVFSVEGNFISISSLGSADTEKVYNLDEFKAGIYQNLSEAEANAVDSFQSGGLLEDTTDTSAEIFNASNTGFLNKYASKYFTDDNAGVTLEKICRKLRNAKLDEGAYKFMAVFKDEDGRPIGIKRAYFLLQSAIAETRDVEIKYKWEMTARDWVIEDQMLLLAKYSEPVVAGSPYGSVRYSPKCGDHSEDILGSHFFGDPGPMWYPYDRCYEPKYDVSEVTDAVKCKSPVEGFSSEYEGKRWSYWERMRGPDKYRTWISGPIFLVGCFYRDVSYTYETVDEQNFIGYTRVRSCHPFGPFSKDREALHINRHFIKRNLKVRDEVIQTEDDDNVVEWSDDYYQYIYSDSGDNAGGVRVGSDLDTAVWIHLNDGVSIVNRTTSEAQHPFVHYLLSSVGTYDFSETYVYDESNRYSLDEVIQDRDLTRIESRDPDSQTLLYSPDEPGYFSDTESYSDIIPVYIEPGTSWAWLERPKDPERYTDVQITGIRLYNPSQTVWKKDRTSAVHSDEGSHSLSYTPPVFDSSGNLTSSPTLSWFDGPPRELNWFTGEWADTGTVYDASLHASKPNFSLFGLGGTSSFLIDGSGFHTYILNTNNDGTTYGTTFRGLGVNSKVQPSELPYETLDFIDEDGDASRLFLQSNDDFKPGQGSTVKISMKGYVYVDRIEVQYRWSTWFSEENRQYDIPSVNVYGLVEITEDGTTSANKAYLTATGDHEGSEVVSASASGGNEYKNKEYSVNVRCDHLFVEFGSIPGDGHRFIESVKIWYRKPTERSEPVTSYERKVGVSNGNTGFPDYRELLYYYNRTIASAPDTLKYDSLLGDEMPSIKLTSKSVKDVVLEYEFYDPSGTRFAYKEDVKPENNALFSEDSEGLLTYNGSVDICTKGRTLIAGTHIDDNPQTKEGQNYNTDSQAPNETSSCADNVGNLRLQEDTQECLYGKAKNLAGNGGTVVSTFEWFWHPDELDFWVDIAKVDLSGIAPTLTLTSTVSPLYKLFQHEDFGCSSETSVPYYDGHLHYIPKWQAMGHWLHVGSPSFNHACYEVVVFKIGKHLEADYETYDYGSNKEGPNWPYRSYKDSAFYLDAGRVEKRGTYMGGRIGGVGLDFWVQQSQFAHGETLPQQIDSWETYEAVEGGRTSSTRAEASRSGYHTDDDPSYNGN